MYKVYLSPSTQEKNIGVGNYGTEETQMNLIADVVYDELARQNQFKIYRNVRTWTLNQVIADSDKIKPDIHVAIHSNALNGKTRGVLGLYWSGGGTNSNSYKLTKIIHDKILAIFGKDNGMRAGTGLAETDRVKATSTIIEIAFHDNWDDATWIMNNIKPVGIAIAQGICKYFNVVYVPEYIAPVVVEPEPIPIPEPIIIPEEVEEVREKLTYDQILVKYLDEPDTWRDVFRALISTAEAEGDIGKMEILKYIPTLFEKIHNN